MRFWRRSASLQLGNNRYSLDDLTFTFKVRVEDRPKVGIAEISVTNLAPTTRAALEKGMPVILNAGYQGDVGLIFAGNIAEFSHDYGETDTVTKITAADAMDAWLAGQVNKTYKPGITAREVLDDLLVIFGVEVALAQLAVNKTYPRGRVCRGKLKDVLKEIVVSDCGSRLMIRNGQIIISPPDEGIATGYHLTPETGLLKDTEKMETRETAADDTIPDPKTSTEQKEADGGMKVSCLLNYHIGCVDIVVIEDSEMSGQFMVKALTHEGSLTGQWKSILEVQPS